MTLIFTIEKAAAIAGTQAKLAEMLGERQQHVSNWKAGTRTCTIEKRIKLAQIAGLDPKRAAVEGLIDQLDETDKVQQDAKAMLQSMLDAFPPDHSSIIRRHQGAKHRQLDTTRRRRRRGQIAGNCGISHIKPQSQRSQCKTRSTQPEKLQLLSR